MFKFTFFFALATILLLVSSCSKENKLAKDLEGDWSVEIFAQEGIDLIGTDIFSIDIEFKDYDKKTGEGSFTWITQYPNVRQVVTGDYFINPEGTQLNFDNTSEEGFFFEFDIELNEDDLELETSFEDLQYHIEVKRR